jgi:glycosyltransferase involved in cell wall biosynthesis
MTRADARNVHTFTIVIPTYNEGQDIAVTCDAVRQLSHNPEVIFVDGGSTDDTRTIIRRYLTHPSMRLIEEGARRGVAAARNAGARAASGDVIVFLNADVRLPADFLDRLVPHYDAGADSVAVDARALNLESVFGRFLEAQHRLMYGPGKAVGWTEGFSCRRSLALDVGLFPEQLPGAGGEDGEFVARLKRAAAHSVFDRSIVVEHVTPSTWTDFWRQWEGRGVSVPILRHLVHGAPWPRVVAERMAASLWSLLLMLLIVPVVGRAIALTRHSARGWRDVPGFLVLRGALVTAHRIGEWKGLIRLSHRRAADAR